MTEYQIQAMSRTGETGELPLRNVAPGSSGGGSAVALSLAKLNDIARDAQIAFCLGKASSYEVAFARGIEAAHGIGATAGARG